MQSNRALHRGRPLHRLRAVALLAALAASALCLAFADDSRYIQNCGDSAKIDWTNGRVFIKGIGIPKATITHKTQRKLTAKQAAKDKAYSDWAAIIHGVAVDNATKTVDSASELDVIDTKIRGLVKGGIVHDKVDGTMQALGFTEVGWSEEDDAYTVVIEIPLNGIQGLASAVLPVVTQPNYHPAKPEAEPQYQDVPATESPREVPAEVTGLIVDGSSTDVVPAMNPKLFERDSKQEVYGTANIDTDTAIKRGVVGYATSLATARKASDRVGDHPMIVPAAGAVGTRALMVSADDAKAIRDADRRGGFLKRCAVMFVLKAPK